MEFQGCIEHAPNEALHAYSQSKTYKPEFSHDLHMVVRCIFQRTQPCAYSVLRHMSSKAVSPGDKATNIINFWKKYLAAPRWQQMIDAANDLKYKTLKDIITSESIIGVTMSQVVLRSPSKRRRHSGLSSISDTPQIIRPKLSSSAFPTGREPDSADAVFVHAPTTKKFPYPVGTKIIKHFEGFGMYQGEISSHFKDAPDLCHVRFTDNDEEDMDVEGIENGIWLYTFLNART